MRLRVRARLVEVNGAESSSSGRPMVRMKFEAVGQPDFEPLYQWFVTDHEVAYGFLLQAMKALGVDPIRSLDQYVVARAVEDRYDGREVTIVAEFKSFNGRDYLRPIGVEPVSD